MSVKETTTFSPQGGNISVQVSGSEMLVQIGFLIPPLLKFKLSRQEAKDLSIALRAASEIVRTAKKRKPAAETANG